MHKKIKVTISLLLSLIMLCTVLVVGSTAAFAASSTGVGLSAHCLNAYNEGWDYVWGGSSPGAVDCSGLIYSYNGVGGNRVDMLSSSGEWGYVSNGIPRVHGLGLHKPGHVGVYVGGGMAIDARSSYYDMCYSSVYELSWVEWFKIYGVEYPTKGWVRYNGDSFYYEKGQYIVNTTRTFDGVTYTFGSDGASDIAPPESEFKATDYSSGSISSSGSSGNTSGTSKLIKIGSQGEKVEKIQKQLKSLGYFEDDVTGYFGTYTEKCIKAFQKAAKIEVDGIVGQETMDALFADDAPKKSKNTNDSKPSEQPEAKPTDAPEQETAQTQEPQQDTTVEAADEASDEQAEMPAEEETQVPTEEETEAPTKAPTEPPTEAPTEDPYKDLLAMGGHGDKVVKLQQRLTELGYYSAAISGEFDEETLNALKAYYEASELQPLDYMSDNAFEALMSDNAISSADYEEMKLSYEGYSVESLQTSLVSLGYLNQADASGEIDDKTTSAIMVAQSNFEMEVTGEADKEFLDAIDKQTTQEAAASVQKIVKTSPDKALSPAKSNVFEAVSYTPDTESNYNMLLIIAAIMSVLSLAGLIVYLKSRKSAVKAGSGEKPRYK
ncbi:MAG: peptidoglycan-binding protein [Acutalibacteraceae bacterium]